jgi:hypothetical protein
MPPTDAASDEPMLAKETLLVRARDLVVHLSDADEIGIDLAGERVTAPRIALAVLDAFTAPRSVEAALASVGGAGPEQWIEASAVVMQLARAGVLHAPGEGGAAKLRGFVRPAIHIAMLNDRARTHAFCEALRARVTPSDTVIDIGTGTGVLATCAALAGARRVYAVESTGIADVAERVFAANGVADRVVLVRERSTHANLPQRASVLVTETIGNDPLDEQILEIVADARRRLLAPDARTIPSALEIVAVPVDVPSTFFERHAFTRKTLEAYRADYGIDFSPLASHRLGPTQPVMIKTEDARAWRAVCAPANLATIDLEGAFETAFDARVRFALEAPAAHLGVFFAFRATLAPGIAVSTLPAEVDPHNAWRYALWLALDLPDLEAGAAVQLDYRYERGTSTVRFSRG